jgi:predicted PurR-regulated permease PerM
MNQSDENKKQPVSNANALPIWLKALLGMAAFVVVIAGLKAASAILVPFLLALFIAIISAPALFWMQQKGVRPFVAIIVVTILLLICGVISVRRWPIPFLR